MSSLSIAYPEMSVQEIVAAVVARVLEANDVGVELITGPADSLTPLLEDQEVDIFATAWLPRDEKLINKAYAPIGHFYSPRAVCCLNGERGGITSIADVAANAQDFETDVIVMQSLKEVMEKVFEAYGLKEKGFTAHVLPDDVALERIDKIAQGDTPHLLPVLDPSYVMKDSTLQILEDPKNVLPAPEKASVLVRKALFDGEYQEIWDELDELMITNKILNVMDYAVHKQKLPPEEAADAWQRGKLIQR